MAPVSCFYDCSFSLKIIPLDKSTRVHWQKLAFLGTCLFVSGSFGFLVPFVSNFYLILPVLLATGITIGSFNTANNSLVVYMMGPKK